MALGLLRPGQHQGLSHRGCRGEEGPAGLAGDLFLGRLKKERGFGDKPKAPAWAIRASSGVGEGQAEGQA